MKFENKSDPMRARTINEDISDDRLLAHRAADDREEKEYIRVHAHGTIYKEITEHLDKIIELAKSEDFEYDSLEELFNDTLKEIFNDEIPTNYEIEWNF